MAAFNFDLGDYFNRIWGYRSPAFDPVLDDIKGVRKGLRRKERGTLGSPYYAVDAEGREYYMPVSIEYTDASGVLNTINLPHPVISYEGRKNLVRTALTERNADAIEIINTGGYTINIKGFLIGEANEYPEELKKLIDKVFEINAAVTLRCVKTDFALKGVGFKVVFEKVNYPDLKGVKHVQPYEISCVSDLEFSLEEV